MGANSDRVADFSLDEQPSSKLSFLSRLTLPLRSRSRNLADFHIRPDEPHRQYQAGDHVTGSVILSVIKPIRITHLTVALHGYVRVFKNATAAAQLSAVNPALIPNDGSRNFRYYGNGHASLFQDEQVLCGEGRLSPSKFEFKFDLIFPSKGLPSSIDFERGTISYMITATLTRPTSIAPTTSCERKVSLVEQVDIGLLVPPRERKVTMQAMHRRKRGKKAAVTTAAVRKDSSPTDTPEPASDMDSIRANETSNDSSVVNPEEATTQAVAVTEGTNQAHPTSTQHGLYHSDMQSEFSAESATSNNSNSMRGADACGVSVAGSKLSGAGGIEDREITATVELLKGGCLPGDALTVRIRVDHNRRMKSMHGIIVTFYRQGRVDYAPPASLFKDLSKEDAQRLEREEYYPKSKTGLGGLSLSSAGSCSVFRKDLSQAVAPLIIDPTTLSANITTSVRVPEDVFPSIRSVPGGLISFKYHVEVVVDLGGRLAGQSQGSSQSGRVGSVSVPGAGAASTSATSPYDGGHLSRLANYNGTIVDTDQIRREKGVISVSFEVVVGTSDSNRTRGKSVDRPTLTVQSPLAHEVALVGDDSYTWQNEAGPVEEYYGNGPYAGQYPLPASTSYYDFHNPEAQAPGYVPPPPQILDRTGLSEKERMRQAEQRLLPSQPPSQPSAAMAGPSQPPPSANGPSQPSAPPLSASAPEPHGDDDDDDDDDDDGSGEGPSAPTLADISSAAASHPTDDKQELERRWLMEEASAPPEVPEDYEGGEPSAPLLHVAGPAMSHEPSAPALDEEDMYGPSDPYESIAGPSTARGSHRQDDRASEPLPKYVR